MEPSNPLLWQFDVARKLGWAVYADGKLHSGSQELTTPGGEIGPRAAALWRFMRKLAADYGTPDVVGFETPLMPKGQSRPGKPTRITANSTRPGIALCGIVELFAELSTARCYELPQGTWRKAFLGIGAGRTSEEFKALSISTCRQLGFEPADDNEADAIGQMDTLLHLCRIVPPWREELRLIVEGKAKPKAGKRKAAKP